MLESIEVTKKYVGKIAVDGITMQLEPGHIYAMLGPNGSGKTTWMKMAAGLIKPTFGEIRYNGQPISIETRKEIAYMSTEPYFYDYMTVGDVGKYYQDFFDDEPCEILLEPYFVRVFHQRWYVIGVMLNAPEGEEPEERTKQGRIRRYALDRVHRIFATEDTFKMPRGLSVDSYFADAFGIIVEPEVLIAERIRIKATDINHRRDYLRKLPIHWSQREVEKHSDYSIFEVTVMPTYDFIQHILSMSSEVEVISPEYVRKEVIRWIREMASIYGVLS